MPQRFLRPGITNSDRWNSVDLLSQSLFIRILTKVDDYGRYDARPSVLVGECFSVWNDHHPDQQIDSAALSCALLRLAAANLIELYEVQSKKVLQVTQWQERIREGAKEKWPKNPNPLRIPADSCGFLPPSSPPSPSPSPSPSTLSGKPDITPPAVPVIDAQLRGPEGTPQRKTPKYHPDAKAALAFLNQSCGKEFREVESNLTIISARLSEPDVTLDGVKAMITRQCRKWLGTEMDDYLRPETLFGKKKFDGYYAAKDQPLPTTTPRPEPNQTQEALHIPRI